MAEPTVIDSLIVTLGLDPSNFDGERKRVAGDFLKLKGEAASASKEMQARGKQAAEFYGSIKKEALGLFAVITGAGGLERFTERTVTNFSAMGRAAQAMGVGTSQLAAFQNMIVRNGGQADAARASLQSLSKSQQEWKVLGNTAALPYLNRIGANANDDALAVYEKFAKYASTVNPKTANLVGQGLGLDEASINQALKGADAYQKQMQLSYKLGVPSDKDVKTVTELQRAFLELRQTITGDAQAILEFAAPALTGLINLVDRGAQAFPGLTKGVIAFGVALSGLSALKFAGAVLKLFSPAAAATGAAEAAAAGTGIAAGAGAGGLASTTAGTAGTGVAAGAVAAPVLAVAGLGSAAWLALHPSHANEGEGAALARHNAATKAGDKGYDEDRAVRTLIGEARVGDVTGMKDVAHVIRNRMTASGKSASDVVMQKGQFEPWMTDASSKRLLSIDKRSAVYQTALKAWRESQVEKDSTGGATLFVSPGGQAANGRNMPAWATPEMLTMARGGHQFYKGNFPGGQKVDRSVHIDSVTITTQATDAKGIAQDFQAELGRQNLVNKANVGLF